MLVPGECMISVLLFVHYLIGEKKPELILVGEKN